MSEAMRVGAHVEVLRGPAGGRYPHGNPVLVTGPDRRVLIDSALGVDVPEVDAVLLSHYHEDHVVGLAGTPYETWIHDRDVPGVTSTEGFVSQSGFGTGPWLTRLRDEFGYEPLPQVHGFADDSVFELGGDVRVHVIALPGHTAGHSGFFVEPDGIAFLGDVDLSRFGPFYGDASGSLDDTVDSLDRCAQLEAAVYLTYHHKGPYEERRAFLDALGDYRAVLGRRRDQVLGLLDVPRSAGEMVGSGVVYRPGTAPEFGAVAEERMCERHLRQLAATGAVDGPDGAGRYRRVARSGHGC